MLEASFAEIDMISQGGSGVLREGTGPRSLWEPSKIFQWAEVRSEELPAYKPSVCKVSLQLLSSDPYCFWQVTRQLQIKITSSAPAPVGSALTETGSGWFSNQWKGIRTSPTYCWEGQGCAWGSGQPGSITAVLQCRSKCRHSHGQVLLSGTSSVQR